MVFQVNGGMSWEDLILAILSAIVGWLFRHKVPPSGGPPQLPPAPRA